MTHHVFLSYSRRDSDYMSRIRDFLREGGLQVWTDEALEAGTESWKKAIQDAIENTACIVVILSPDSKQSVWVQRELDYASTQGRRIYPIMVRGDSATSVPFLLASAQYADVRTNFTGGMKQLQKAVHKFVAVPVYVPPQPEPEIILTEPEPPITPEEIEVETPSLIAQQLVMTKVSPALIWFKNLLPYISIAILLIIGFLAHDLFISSRNVSNMAMQMLPVGFLALAGTILLLVKSIDMSAGASMGASALTFTYIMRFSEEGLFFLPAVIAAITIAVLIGLILGFVIRSLRNAFTLSNQDDTRFMALMFVSPSVLITSISASLISSLVLSIGIEAFGGGVIVISNSPFVLSSSDFPFVTVVLIMLYVLFEYFIRRPQIRNAIEGLRSNLILTRTKSENMPMWFLIVFAFAGFFIALAGIMYVTRLRSYSPYSIDFSSLLYSALAAIFIGGSSLFSDRISFLGTVLGVIAVTMIANLLAFSSLPSYLSSLIIILLLIATLILDFYATPRPKLVQVDE